jgi:C4-dicarboxylate transporter, DctM subunit
MILYAVVAQQSLGKLFLAGIGPGLLLVALFAAWSVIGWRREYRRAEALASRGGPRSAILHRDDATMRQRFALLPRVLPFVVLMLGVMVALYGGYATPSETAGLGAVLALVIVALAYQFWRVRDFEPILEGALRESSMILMIIATSALYVYTMSYLHISQSAAQAIVVLHLSPWVLFSAVLCFMILLGFFLPPVSIILMTGPILLPPLRESGFNLVWFGVVMMIVMEMGLIHPPVGLNLFVIRSIAPDIKLREVIWGTLPFLALMVVAIGILIAVPDIVLWLPDHVIRSE